MATVMNAFMVVMVMRGYWLYGDGGCIDDDGIQVVLVCDDNAWWKRWW